jgi:hypothetical protein
MLLICKKALQVLYKSYIINWKVFVFENEYFLPLGKKIIAGKSVLKPSGIKNPTFLKAGLIV